MIGHGSEAEAMLLHCKRHGSHQLYAWKEKEIVFAGSYCKNTARVGESNLNDR